MALTKTPVNLHSSADPAAGGSVTEAAVNLAAVYGGSVNWKITNGTSAPSTVPTVEVQVSTDGVKWVRLFIVGGDTTANSINSGSYPVRVATSYIRAILTAGATNASTFMCEMDQVTAY